MDGMEQHAAPRREKAGLWELGLASVANRLADMSAAAVRPLPAQLAEHMFVQHEVKVGLPGGPVVKLTLSVEIEE